MKRYLNYALVLAIIAATAILTQGCASEKPLPMLPTAYGEAAPPPPPVAMAPAPPPPEPVMLKAPAPSAYPEKATLLARVFAFPKTQIDANYANIILFARKPLNAVERDTYLAICENWKANFPEEREINLNEVPSEFEIVKFYWPLKKDALDTNSCADLVDQYDYARAKIYLTTRKLDVNKNQIVCRVPSGHVVMNVNSLKKPGDIQLAFKAWQMRMTLIPTKQGEVHIYTLADSAKAVLGALGSLVSLKL